jgi:predicted MFS family arabinose efflux permease
VQIPVRLVYLLRPSVAFGVLLAVGLGTLAFTSTPFLIPELADHYDLGLGAVSMVSVFQLGGFVVSTWGAGRWLKPEPRVFVLGLVGSAIANAASATLPLFPLLVVLRLVSGLALGLIAWYGWLQGFGDDRRMVDVAVTGPIVGVFAAPLLSIIIDSGGIRSTFLFLAATSLVPLALGPGSVPSEVPVRRSRHRPVTSARILLICLGLFTVGGSSVFQYAVVLGTGAPGLSATAIALGFTGNALVGIPAARMRRRRGIPGPWMAATAVCAFVLATSSEPGLFLGAVIFWGFAFWMAVPGVFKVLARVSRYPEERAGDAQAVMAAGRAFGPFLGGVLIDGPGHTALGIIGGAVMLTAALGVFTVRTAAHHEPVAHHEPGRE